MISAQEIDLVRKLYHDLRAASRAAEAADAQVVKHKNRINRYCDRQNYAESSRRDKLKMDYDFQDALERYRAACAEVQRIGTTLQGMIAALTFLEQHNM